MTNKEGYNYDEFLKDSSDDFPQGDTSIKCGDSDDSSKCSKIIIHPNDDETNYKEAYEKPSVNRMENKENLKIALHNVLELAVEQLNVYSKDCVEANKIIAEQSIEMVRKYMESIQDPNINNL